ncbi:membrane protein [Clostridia bacterium]|nr:membrane protein [Clostridia bacterium]
MPGVLINTGTILLGGFVGLLLGKGIPERLRETVMQGVSLCVVLIGIKGALQTQDVLGVIMCLVIGALLGEWINVERRLEALGARAQRLLSRGQAADGAFVQGFMTASLLFCVGAMAVVGSLESGLSGNHATLVAKALMDGVSSVFLAAAMGPGVLLSALAILVYQGVIALGAGLIAPLLTAPLVTEMSAVGGLLIVAVGVNMLGAAKVRVGNLLPAIFLPLLYMPLAAWLGEVF